MTVERGEGRHRDSRPIIFVCDACPETLDTGYTTWDYANDARKGAGWTTQPLGTTGARGAEEWAHYCPACGKRASPSDFGVVKP